MATINLTLAAGSVASPYYYDCKITKQLCTNTPSAPVFTPVFSLVSYASVGTGEYQAVVNVQGIVTYTPCGKCCAKTQTVNENFILPFYTATAPTAVSVSSGTAVNALVTSGCSKCGNTFVCDVPLNLTVTTA